MVIGRLSIAQLYEHEINFISDNVLREINTRDKLEDKERLLFAYYDIIHKDQGKVLRVMYDKLSDDEKDIFYKELNETGIFIHQPPFFDNATPEQLIQLYTDGVDGLKIEPYKMKIKLDDVEEEYKTIDKPLIMGDLYMIR